MQRLMHMPLGVVVERRAVDSPWQDHAWRAVAVIPGAPQPEGRKELARGPRWVRYHAATLPLELHYKETAAYRVNLSDAQPAIYVGIGTAEGDGNAGFEITPFLVTASPFEAQAYLDGSDVTIDRVPMPAGLVAWIQAFIDAHHVEQPFERRKSKRFEAPADRERVRNG